MSYFQPGSEPVSRPNITAAAYASSMRSSHQPVGAALRTVNASGLHVVVDQTRFGRHTGGKVAAPPVDQPVP